MGCCWRTIVDQNHEPKDGLFCNVIVRDPVQQNTWIYDSNGIYSEGTAGKAATITVGATTTGEPGTDAKVENVGDVSQAVLNFTIPRGDKGDKGDKGEQGDQGPEGQQGVQGEKGDPGEPFQIRKIYSSVAEMEADYNNPGIEEGDFVLINTNDVSDPDNAKLYVKGPTGWQFVTDLSGAQGIQGPKGDTGSPAGFGSITATVDDTVGTPAVSVQSDGPNTAKNIAFNFSGLKGEKGDPGQAGTEVNSILPLTVETPPDEGNNTGNILFGNNIRMVSSSGASKGVGIGDSIQTDSRAVSIGSYTYAGYGAVAIGLNSHAEGYGSSMGGIALGEDARTEDTAAVAIGVSSRVTRPSGGRARNSVALGSFSSATEGGVVSVGSGDATMALSDDMDEETKARIQARASAATRRIVNVTDPENAQDAATKNYVDTQLTPINAKLQYVPENTNQILSQIQTNVEKAQSAADAKVASITAGTGISVDASNPTAPVVSAVGLATQSSVDALTSTVNSKADQTAVDSLTTTVNGKVSSVSAGEGISITGTATEPVISATSNQIADTGWLDISNSGLNYLTGPFTIPSGSSLRIRKFGNRVTLAGTVQATEDIGYNGFANTFMQINTTDGNYDAFKPVAETVALSVSNTTETITAFYLYGSSAGIRAALCPVLGNASSATPEIRNGEKITFQVGWDTED